MGCLCSTPGPQGVPLDTLSDAQRKAADEARAKAEADRKAEAERREAERKEKEKADKIKADAEAEEKRIAAERETARLEAEAKQRREEELFREVKWKEEQLKRREAEVAAREAEAAARDAMSPRARGYSRGKSPKSQTRTLASPKAATPKGAAAPAAEADGKTEAASGGSAGAGAGAGAFAGGAGARPGSGGAAAVRPTDVDVGVDVDDDSAEYRRAATAADREREKVAENPDLKSVRLALSDTLAFWSTKPGGKSPNLLLNADATQPAAVGWTKEEGTDWATTRLPVGGGVPDLPAVATAFVCAGRSVRSQKIDLLQRGIPAQVLSHCPKIELRTYYTASAPNAVKFKVTADLLDDKGQVIDSFVQKKTAPSGAGPNRWGEIFHTFKQSATYDRAPRYVLYKEHGRDKVLRDKMTGKVIAVGGAVTSPRAADDDSDIGSPKSPRPTAVGGAGGADANAQAAGLEQPPHYQGMTAKPAAAAAAAGAGAAGGSGVRQLSSTVRSMKFMQRVDEAAVRRKLEAEQQREVQDSHWVLHSTAPATASSNLLLDETDSAAAASAAASASAASSSSATATAGSAAPPPFKSGRRSFGRFNPVVEKLVADVKRDVAAQRGEANAISDEQLANRYSRYVGGTGAGAGAAGAAAAAAGGAAADVGGGGDDDDDDAPDPKKRKTASGAPASASDRPRPLRGKGAHAKRTPSAAAAAAPAQTAKHSAAAAGAGAGSKRDKPAAHAQQLPKGFLKPRDLEPTS